MELRRVLLKTALILFFIRFGLSQPVSLSSRFERRALMELRSSLGIRSKYWPKKAEPCSNWTGIECQKGRVVGINISGLRRTQVGSLHSSFAVDALSNITLLMSFNASGFPLNGSIPQWFGLRLSALQTLDLRSCLLSGLIPSSLGDLRKLNTLILSHNSLTGRMPSTLGQLLGLSVLDLSRNSLAGSIPFSLSSLRNLTRLDISSNFLSGSIPSGIGYLYNLQIFNLSDNSFSASIPDQLGNLSRLVELDVSRNSLSGPLPDILFSKFRNLRSLILSQNDFDQGLPAALWSMPKLHFLDVSKNNFTGTLPELSKNVNSTSTMYNLSDNFFYGFLNISFKKFRIIDLSSNYFQGEVSGDGNVSLARNCLQMIPNQRSHGDCSLFYGQRGLTIIGLEPTQLPLPEPKSGNSKRVVFTVAGVFGGIGFIVLIVLLLRSIANQKGTADVEPVPEGESPRPPDDPLHEATSMEDSYTYEQILLSSGNFSEANFIKHGHSGDLFRGILRNGVNVVVKKVDLNSFKRESYMAELGLLSKFSHTRLIPLLGHCLENENEKFLVYKYMPNGDLATSLHGVSGPDDKLHSLDWITRLKIAIGAAEGLSYLHECCPPLVHRDVQASSILLDDKFEVRLGSLSEITVQGDIHQSVIARFFRTSQYSDQGISGSASVTCAYDIYSFGKVLLELVTGELGVSNSDDATTREWLEQTLSYINIFDKEHITKIVDPSLILDDDLMEEVWAMAIVARSCLNPRPSKRPPMRYVLKALENPLKVVRDETYSSSSAKLRTTSSRRSWSTAIFGSWRQSSSESATVFKHSGRVGSHGSGGIEYSSSNKRLSSEIFPELLEIQGVEAG